jgi:hypothetical protein
VCSHMRESDAARLYQITRCRMACRLLWRLMERFHILKTVGELVSIVPGIEPAITFLPGLNPEAKASTNGLVAFDIWTETADDLEARRAFYWTSVVAEFGLNAEFIPAGSTLSDLIDALTNNDLFAAAIEAVCPIDPAPLLEMIDLALSLAGPCVETLPLELSADQLMRMADSARYTYLRTS